MGTEARVVLYAASQEAAEAAARPAFGRIAELDSVLSDYRLTGDVAEVNRNAGAAVPIRVGADLVRVLGAALALADQTDGAFDPTIGAVTAGWREARAADRALSDAESCALARLVDWRAVELDSARGTVRLVRAGMRLDLGGIGKGYAADEALATLRRAGVERALVAIGGDIVVGRAPPASDGWRVVVPGGTRPTDTLIVESRGVATSGDSEQFVEVDGVRYSHVVDPRTGAALTNRARVTVVAATGLEADAWATVLPVLGAEERVSFMQARAERAFFRVVVGEEGDARPPCGGAMRETVPLENANAASQAPVRVPSAPSCPTCGIVFDRLVTVTGNDAPGRATINDVATRTASGDVVVAHIEEAQLSIFDASGRYVRTVGRRGAGPGEYQTVIALATNRDTIHAFDVGNSRRTVLSPSGQVVRASPIPPQLARNQAIVLGDDRTLINAQIRSGAAAGQPIHILNGRGVLERSFGDPARTVITRENNLVDLRSLAQSARGGVWSSRRRDLNIELWDLRGTLLRSIVREASWPSTPLSRSQDGPRAPVPTVVGLWEDGEGRLWVYITVADTARRQGLVAMMQNGVPQAGAYEVGDPARMWDTIVEVIDPRSARILATRVLDQWVSHVLADGSVLTVSADAEGGVTMEFLRPRLVRGERDR